MTKKKFVIIKREFDNSDTAIKNCMTLLSIDRRFVMHINITLDGGSTHHMWMDYRMWIDDYLLEKALKYGNLRSEPSVEV